MKCSDVQELIPQFINQAVDKSQEKLIFEHLSSCTECVDELAFWISIADCNKVEKIVPSNKKKIRYKVINDEGSTLELAGKAIKLYFKLIKQAL